MNPHDNPPPPEGTPGVVYCRFYGETELQKFQRQWDAEYDRPDPEGSEFGA